MTGSEPTGILDVHLLTDLFGRWPSFHDAEIVSLLMERGDSDGPSLTAAIHTWQMTGTVGADGCYILEKETLVTLLFAGIVLHSLSGFNNQNVLSQLEITAIDPALPENERCRFSVVFDPTYGCGASLLCRAITVVSCVPRALEPD